MSTVHVDDTTRAGWALLTLNTHGSPDRIADHLYEHGHHGDHHTDTCPIHNYLRAETGLDVRVTALGWRVASDHRFTLWRYPEHVEQFIARHDRGHYPDLAGVKEDPTTVQNTCCNDTGLADYAAVPCPNPTCTAAKGWA